MTRLKLPKSPRILVTRTDALGDVILTTPVYRALKATFADSHLAVVCREYTEPVLRHNPCLDERVTIELERPQELSGLTERVRKGAYDIAIILYPSSFIAAAVRDAQVPIRIGSARRFHSWKFTHRINQSRKRNLKSEAQYNLDLLRVLGVEATDIHPEVFAGKSDRVEARGRLNAVGINTRFVVLHPGSGGSAIDWPVEKFAKLGEVLHKLGIPVVFTGNDRERALIEFGLRHSDWPFCNLAGKTTVLELAGILELAAVVVANSTGPLHLAAAVGTPTVGLFPQTAAMSPVRWAPPVANTLILQPESVGAKLKLPVETVVEAILSVGPSLATVKVSK